MLLAAGAGYFFYSRRSRQGPEGEVAYVLPRQLDVVDTTAEIRLTVGTLKTGDRVGVLERSTHWMKIRLPNGKTGWVENKDMLDEETYRRAQRLAGELGAQAPQAAGHVTEPVNLRLEPARDAPLLAQLEANRKVEIFARRPVDRPPPDQTASASQPSEQVQPDGAGESGQHKSKPVRDAWYLVRTDSTAGWLLGRMVELDVPPAILPYAQGFNMVGWQVLKTVDDGGRQVPEYLSVERIGSQDVDFNHVRVFTWWKKRQMYVTAYVESGLDGFFPLRVTGSDVPYFRLRLIDEDGHKVQKVYGMFDTIVRPLGTVEGWETDAMPEPPPKKAKSKRARHARRRK